MRGPEGVERDEQDIGRLRRRQPAGHPQPAEDHEHGSGDHDSASDAKGSLHVVIMAKVSAQ